jgi:hypothetical protein
MPGFRSNSPLASSREVLGKVERLTTLLSRAEELADTIHQDLARTCCQSAFGVPSSHLPGHPPARGSSAPSEAERHLREQAEQGVESVKMTKLSNHKSLVSIDGGEPFELSDTLTHLLTHLCQDQPSEDALVGWKTLEQIALKLEKQTGRHFSRQSVNNNLYRLRLRLRAAGVNWYLVQTRQPDGTGTGHGARFALKRPTLEEAKAPLGIRENASRSTPS